MSPSSSFSYYPSSSLSFLLLSFLGRGCLENFAAGQGTWERAEVRGVWATENSPRMSSVRGDCVAFQQHTGSSLQPPSPPAGGQTRDVLSPGRGQRSKASEWRRIICACLRSNRRSSRISTAYLIPSPATLSTPHGGQTRDWSLPIGCSWNRFFRNLCLSDGEPCPTPSPVRGNPRQNFAHTPPQPIYESNEGGVSGKNCPLGTIFSFFIVVLNRWLQSFSFLVKLICLLTMSLALIYMLFWFHLTDLTTE